MHLLICSHSKESQSLLAQQAIAISFNVTTCSSLTEAEKYFSMTPFDFVLIDAFFGAQRATSALNIAWKHNPLMYGAIFNLDGATSQPWEAKLFGAEIFDSPDALKKIVSALTTFKQSKESAESNKKKVMYIEDLDAPRQIITAYLESLGYKEIDSFSDPHLALETLDRDYSSYFCILSDIRMPKLDGIELLTKIRKTEKLKHLPVIFLTAVASMENVITSLAAGVTGFLAKPPEKRQLSAELEKALRIHTNKLSPRLCKAEDAHLLGNSIKEKMKIF